MCFTRYPFPGQITLNQGTEFMSEFAKMVKDDYSLKIKAIRTRNPQAKSIIERVRIKQSETSSEHSTSKQWTQMIPWPVYLQQQCSQCAPHITLHFKPSLSHSIGIAFTPPVS
jgi:hypothetical protein